MKFLQCTFFLHCLCCSKAIFCRGSQGGRHLYFLAKENEGSNVVQSLGKFCLRQRDSTSQAASFSEKIKMASTLYFFGKNTSLRSSLQSLRCINPHSISTGAIVQCLSSFVRSSDLTEAVSAYSSLLKFYPFKSVFSSAGGLNFELIRSQSLSHL